MLDLDIIKTYLSNPEHPFKVSFKFFFDVVFVIILFLIL